MLVGFCSVGMEIVSSRLLAPYYGTSIFVWSNIIAVILLALAVGYWIGGKVADRRPQAVVLTRFCLAAGIIFVLVPKVAPYLISRINIWLYDPHPTNFYFFLASFITALILFGLPTVFLGMAGPMLVKIYNLSRNQVGESTGLVFGVSTLGSIVGTIVPTFWLLPWLGTAKTIYFFAAILIVIGLFGFSLKRWPLFAILVAAVGISFLIPKSVANQKDRKLIYQSESAYHHIEVWEGADGSRYLLFNEGLSVESIYNPNKTLTGGIYDYYNLLPYANPETDRAKQVLLIGLAGATIPRQLNHYFGDQVQIDAVEVDPKVVEVAKDYFDLKSVKANVIVADGRNYLSQTNKHYDLIVVDVFQNEIYIPWIFSTEEFWNKVKARLNDGGMVAMNIHSISPDSPLISAMSNTLAKVFGSTYLVSYPSPLIYSYMLIGGSNPEFGKLKVASDLEPLRRALAKNTQQINFSEKQPLLTDDWAPVEKMLDPSVNYYRKIKLIERI